MTVHFVFCSDLRENIERVTAVYGQTAALTVDNDFSLLQVYNRELVDSLCTDGLMAQNP